MAKRDRSNPKDAEIRNQVKIAEIGRYYVDARAGTGKTQSLADRMAYALKLEVDGQRVYEPSDMLCVTFTNRAEDEMRRRICTILSEDGCGLEKEVRSIYIGNIHKFCYRFLKKMGKGLHPFTVIENISIASFATKESPTVYETSSKKQKVKSVTMEEVRKYAATMRQIQEKHPRMVRMQYFSHLPKTKRVILENLAKQYISYKQQNNYLDFDDILIDTFTHLQDKEIREKNSYRWIQVDEMQDLNPLQHGIINSLVADQNSTVCYYGDICQAIFSFLGTRGNIIKNLPDFGKPGHMFSFTENFRSPDALVKMFDNYIKAYLQPSSYINGGSGHLSRVRPLKRLHFLECSTDVSEKIMVADAVTKILEYNSNTPGISRRKTVAILVRTGEEADAFSRVLLHYKYTPKLRKNARKKDDEQDMGIPHLKVSGSDFLKRDAIKTLLSHFSVVNDEFNRSGWTQILYHLHCGSDYSRAFGIASKLHAIGIIPSDFILYDDSTYLREFYNSVDNESVIVNIENDMLYAMKFSKGQLQDGIFSGPTAKQGDCLDDFLEYVGNAAIVSFMSAGKTSAIPSKLRNGATAFERTRVWSLRKTARLFGENESQLNSLSFLASGLRCSPVVPDDVPDSFRQTVTLFLHHISIAKTKLEEQKIYMSHLGARYLAKKIKEVYGPIYLHSKAIIDNDTKKDSDKILAEEFRWAYKTMLRKKVIHNVNPLIFEKKKQSYAKRLDLYGGSGKFNEEQFEKDWQKVINEDIRQTEVKTEYFFDYLQKSVFADGSRKFVRNLLDEHLQEIKFIRESDLCQQPFVKECVYVMTVHQAKGHEFSDVFVVGASNKTYPFFGHKAKWEQDEDKRLFYVAMSRSRNNLTISYAKKYISVFDNKTYSALPTPYLEHIIEFFIKPELEPKTNGAKTEK